MNDSNSTLVKFCKKCQCDTERYSRGGCKPCAVAQATKWRNKNKNKEKLIKAGYYQRHLEDAKRRNASSYERNKDTVNKRSMEWASANPEKVSASKVKHRESGKETITKRKWRSSNQHLVKRAVHNRRARSKSSSGVLSKWIEGKLLSLQRGKCACCNRPLGKNYHLDHIMPLALGGTNTDDNIQLLRQRCNNQKHAKHPIDFMQSRGFLL